MVTRTLAFLAALAPTVHGQELPAVEPLDHAAFRGLHARVVPARQKWQTIPWQLDLVAARAKAVREKKPLFMWSMNGHPLGCT